MNIEIKIPKELAIREERLKDAGGLLASLVPVIDDQNDRTVGTIQEQFLSKKGPTTLGVDTGHLRRSIRRASAAVTADGILSSIGSNVKYLGVHEFGIDEKVQVGPHFRKRSAKKIIFGKKRVVRVGDVPVRAHSMHMKFPERAPLRRGIASRIENYRSALGAGAARFYES